MYKILIVEDDIRISKMESTLLTKCGYEVKTAFSGTEALLVLEKEHFDLVILDIMLPGMTGDEVLAEIRKKQDVAILCVSAIDALEKQIDMMRKGADDYITKPFHNEEFLVRIEVLLRRSKGAATSQKNLVQFKDIVMDVDNHSVTVNDKEIELTAKEYDILELLMQNPKKVFTKDNIYESVWQEEYLPEDNAVSVHISNLRNKLATANKNETYIKTVWGIGFKMEEK